VGQAFIIENLSLFEYFFSFAYRIKAMASKQRRKVVHDVGESTKEMTGFSFPCL